MDVSKKIRSLRDEHKITQQEMADKLGVSRAAVAKWETDKGLPDISNLIQISEVFNLSLDELIKGNDEVRRKLVSDSETKRWHYLVIIYLLSILVYIGYFALVHRIFMAGFLISTLFMLAFEARLILRERRSSSAK